MSKKKLGIGILSFFLCLAIGFGVTMLLKNQKSTESEPVPLPVENNIAEEEDISLADDSVDSQPTDPEPKPLPDPEPLPDPKPLPPKPLPVRPDPPIPVVPEPEPIKMSKTDFQRMLNDGSDNVLLGHGNAMVSGNVRIRVSGMNPDEPISPTDVQAVRDKIATSMWKSSKVTDVEYDSDGRIISATVTPVY